ncbi:conserved hypothetical protein [Bradyrhizobium sp. ORS 285]|nr:conserved hypothetical protein [Bradyrhizobium sp. ORS 285]
MRCQSGRRAAQMACRNVADADRVDGERDPLGARMTSTSTERSEPISIVFADDGLVPNNPMPFLVYRAAVTLDRDDPAGSIEGVFGRNGWGDMWRNGVYDYLHYHATVHEVLGVASGTARVRFGGDHGQELELKPGDVAILPAGTGHQCISASTDFCIVGAYPPGPKMQVTRPTPENHARALQSIPNVPLPETDPVRGASGPLTRLWRRAR